MKGPHNCNAESREEKSRQFSVQAKSGSMREPSRRQGRRGQGRRRVGKGILGPAVCHRAPPQQAQPTPLLVLLATLSPPSASSLEVDDEKTHLLTVHALTLLLLLLLLHLLLVLLRRKHGGPVGRASCLLLAIGSSSSLKVHVGHPPESLRCVAEKRVACAMSSSGERRARGVKGGEEEEGRTTGCSSADR